MTALDGLKEARRLVEAGWTQGAYAINRDGGVVSLYSSFASCFCAEGAICRAFGGEVDPDSLRESAPGRFFMAAIQPTDFRYLASWNDQEERTQDEVLAAFDRAIALAEAAPGQEGGA